MKNRLLAKLAAVVCASCLAVGVMSSVVFAREEEVSQEPALPEATFVVVDTPSEEAEAVSYEITDNRDAVPYYVNDVECGVCPIISGVPYVSVTGFCQALGLDAGSALSGDTLTLSADGFLLTASAGDIYFSCNGRYLYVENGVQLYGGEIMLPVEALVKCLGVSVSWDRVQWTVTVWEDEIVPLESGDTYYDETDVYWLSRVIYAEAGSQSMLGQAAVGSVVLNRVADESFADQDSVYDVIFAKNQFEVVINGMIYMTPDESAVIAAKLVLEGVDVVSGATYFATYDFGEGYECVLWIEDHCFMTAA